MRTITRTLAGIFAIGIISISANAQRPTDSGKAEEATMAVQKADNILTARLGYYPFPSPSLSYERIVARFNDRLFLGTGLNVGTYYEETKNSKEFRLGMHALVNLHLAAGSSFDILAGLDLGATMISADDPAGKTTYAGNPIIPVHVAASYYISDRFAVSFQLGGWGSINLGLTLRL